MSAVRSQSSQSPHRALSASVTATQDEHNLPNTKYVFLIVLFKSFKWLYRPDRSSTAQVIFMTVCRVKFLNFMTHFFSGF